MPKDPQARKWQITINNPREKGLSHKRLREILISMKASYWCMGDEVGKDEETPHTHVYFFRESPIRFSTIKGKIPEAHLEMCRGTSQDNRDYITKTGKWTLTDKSETTVPNTFEEYGEMPIERPGQRNDLAELYELLKDGSSNIDILETLPDQILNLDRIERARQELRREEYRKKWRDLEVTYISGKTGTGKTRYVMETYGYENVYRVTDYAHPFDTYEGQDVILFDEFRSSLPCKDMLNYLDGYPLVLPCRFTNRQACYTKVFVISNIKFSRQYENVQREEKETFNAFSRRIKRVCEMTSNGLVDYERSV